MVSLRIIIQFTEFLEFQKESLIRHSYNFYFSFIQVVFIIHYRMNGEVRFHFRTKCKRTTITIYIIVSISIN